MERQGAAARSVKHPFSVTSDAPPPAQTMPKSDGNGHWSSTGSCVQRWVAAFTVASSTTIEPDYRAPAPRVMHRFTALGADELQTPYVHTPYVAVSAGYRF